MATLKTLKKIGKHPTWCGPSALSILTGRSVNHCARLIAKRRNKKRGWYNGKGTSKQVKGSSNHEVKMALDAMGFEMIEVKVPLKHHKHQVYAVNQAAFVTPTLRAYMAERGGEQWKTPMLINVTGHYVTALKDEVSDNHSTSHYSKHPHRLKKIEKMWIVRRKRSKVA